ncbi:MAG: hypothetical protein K2N35_06115 [Muribaculaceae bacterium]|nr:hypothetical protein [Muribaculaceae bacterium]
MKFSYIHSVSIRGLFSVGCLLAFILLLSSCSNELPELSSAQFINDENAGESQDPSLLLFGTIEELENISVADVPGDNEGFELKELTYECVDTIELRALLFDVKAKLYSSSNEEKVVGFSAEVGPELVSVEYYPGGEIIPGHDNLITGFYPKVERYRNYSDGSRIGPDVFYDFGSPIRLKVSYPYELNTELGKPSANYDIVSVAVLDYDFGTGDLITVYDFENGVYTARSEGYIKYNLNTRVIDEHGNVFTGEDFYPIYVEDNWNEYCSGKKDRFPQFIGNFYGVVEETMKYIPSLLIDMEDIESYEIMNIGRDVRDVSPNPFPRDVQNLNPGYYYADVIDVGKQYALLSKYMYGTEFCPFLPGSRCDFPLQYLVIDGRIIHFDNLMDGYEGIGNINPKFNVSKVNDGYVLTSELEAHIYGEKFKSTHKLHLIGVDGPVDEFDYLDYGHLQNDDKNELDNLTRGNNAQMNEIKSFPRNDKNKVVIDRRLPVSISNIKTR